MKAAQALVTPFAPDRSAIDQRNGAGRAVLGTEAASDAGIGGVERLGAAGEPIESGVDRAGFEGRQRAFRHAVDRFALGDLPGNLPDLLSGFPDLAAGRLFRIDIGTDDIIVGHDQAVTALQRKDPGQLFHRIAGLLPAGANRKGEGIGLSQRSGKGKHRFRHAPGVDGKHQADPAFSGQIRARAEPGKIPGFIPGQSRNLLCRPPGIAGAGKIKNHNTASFPAVLGSAATGRAVSARAWQAGTCTALRNDYTPGPFSRQ